MQANKPSVCNRVVLGGEYFAARLGLHRPCLVSSNAAVDVGLVDECSEVPACQALYTVYPRATRATHA